MRTTIAAFGFAVNSDGYPIHGIVNPYYTDRSKMDRIAKMECSMQNLAAKLNERCDSQAFDTYWYLKDLKTGEEAARNGDTVVPSASTRKIAILMTALKQVNDGRRSLDEKFLIEAEYQNTTSGTFQHLKPGFEITFFDALVMMIIVSDNTCTGKVADIVGLDEVNALCQSIGMSGTTHRDGRGSATTKGMPWDHPVEASNATTVRDLGILLNVMVDGMHDSDAAAKLGCTTELVNLGMDILSWQKLRQRLPYLLPPDTKVAHKTGTGARNQNDAGVIFADGEPRYIFTVLTDMVPKKLPDGGAGPGTASLHIAQMNRMIWDELVN
jgi:beta-lactamase class A